MRRKRAIRNKTSIRPRMIRPGRLWLGLVGLWWLSLATGTAWAYERTRTDLGVPVFWEKTPIRFFVGQEGSRSLPGEKELVTVKDSVLTWNQLDCARPIFEFGGFLPGLQAESSEQGPNQNVILWVESKEDWNYPSDVLAVTPLRYFQKSGKIYDADILLNGAYFRWSTSTPPAEGAHDVRNTVVHEAGHMLGLDHSFNPEATMFREAPKEEVKKRDLEEDDRLGACRIYPKNPKDQFSFLVTATDLGLRSCPAPEKSEEVQPLVLEGGCQVQPMSPTGHGLLWCFFLGWLWVRKQRR